LCIFGLVRFIGWFVVGRLFTFCSAEVRVCGFRALASGRFCPVRISTGRVFEDFSGGRGGICLQSAPLRRHTVCLFCFSAAGRCTQNGAKGDGDDGESSPLICNHKIHCFTHRS